LDVKAIVCSHPFARNRDLPAFSNSIICYARVSIDDRAWWTLIGGGFGFHFPKGYIHASLAFSGTVEGLNMLTRRKRKQLPE